MGRGKESLIGEVSNPRRHPFINFVLSLTSHLMFYNATHHNPTLSASVVSNWPALDQKSAENLYGNRVTTFWESRTFMEQILAYIFYTGGTFKTPCAQICYLLEAPKRDY